MTQRLRAKSRIFNRVRIALPITVILCALILAVPGIVYYKITHFNILTEPMDPSLFMLQASDITIRSDDNAAITGWWVPGTRGSAGVVLSPGYGMSRSAVLSLAAALNKRGLNVLAYGPDGGAESADRSSSFGLREKKNMLAVLQFLRGREESDSNRIGIWGVDVGAYSALWAAVSIPEVRVMVLDNPYESVFDFLDVRLDEELNIKNRLMQFGCAQIFKLFHIASGSMQNNPVPVERLSDRSILFVKGENRKALGQLATDLYNRMPSEKEMVSIPTSRIRLMEGNELQNYDSKVADFFELNLR